ncbi:Maf family protein [Solemya velesiana gill symbiont]|uniref:dTTP/UTP pyrophosphatase n=1 Tax=Solemya velesiana gill symbiont TaxID=1918948 RepID=A0A1T2KUD1_9GAMM|nr:nucleoside triphosphate pyrophosphatase [Solemya velesiana gill symbiont]OOZ36401.1 septum formation protein Maf [Solemya velesiana gill symbiont]
MSSTLFLAFISPRRRELLRQIGVDRTVVEVNVDETPLPRESPAEYVIRLALAKARAGHDNLGTRSATVLAADTAVVLGDEIMGKPADKAMAATMLRKLSGRTHKVLTGVALVGRVEETRLSVNRVSFRNLEAQEIQAYWSSGEPRDKAGSYGIQGLGAMFISHLEGSFSGVMGLPLFETAELLQRAGIRPLRPWITEEDLNE